MHVLSSKFQAPTSKEISSTKLQRWMDVEILFRAFNAQRPTLNVQHHNQETLTLILSPRERRELIVTSIQHPASSI